MFYEDNCRNLLKFAVQPILKWETLLESPYGINIVSTAPPKKWIHNDVDKFLDENVTNPEVKKWRDPAVFRGKEAFIGLLASADPFYSSINSEIYRCSLVGIASGISSRLSNTTTLVKITGAEDGCDRILQQLKVEIYKKPRYMNGKQFATHSVLQLISQHP